MWYTKNFNDNSLLWICPNTTTIQVSNVLKKLYVQIYSCSQSKHLDENEGDMTTYVDDQDEVCEDEGVIPDNLTKFWVTTMLPQKVFNPYYYYEKGTYQTSTRFEGNYHISLSGDYVNTVFL